MRVFDMLRASLAQKKVATFYNLSASTVKSIVHRNKRASATACKKNWDGSISWGLVANGDY